jgi:hypothetical protein
VKLNKEIDEPCMYALASLGRWRGCGCGHVESAVQTDVMCCGTGAPFAVGGNNSRNILNSDLLTLSVAIKVRCGADTNMLCCGMGAPFTFCRAEAEAVGMTCRDVTC